MGNPLHSLAAQPRIYDVIQRSVGQDAVFRRIASHVPSGCPLVLDVGGGTGAFRPYLRPSTRYLCVDLDPVKLGHLKAKDRSSSAVRGDALLLPVQDAQIDVALCIAVAHHIPAANLDIALSEIRRVLKPSGRLLFLDPLSDSRRWTGRLLWRLDRGSYPHSRAELDGAISRHFCVSHRETMHFLHSYGLWVGTPN